MTKLKDIPESATVLVCAFRNDGGPYTDNVEGKCDSCDAGIMWRPHAPKDAYHICVSCISEELERLEEAGEELPEARITEETRKEITEWFKKGSD